MQKIHAYLTIGLLIAAVFVLNILQANAVPLSYESERIPTIDEFMQLLRNSYEAQRCSPDCLQYEYDTSQFSSTITTEWDLVCSRSRYPYWMQSIFILGAIFGSFFFGYLSDSKRTVGLGFDRGYSGQKTAQYLSGLDMAARMGRKRRSDELLAGAIDPIVRLHLLENAKRGLDFGFGRGFSGMQAARHLIGIEEANDAMGPGRRRRNAAPAPPSTAPHDHSLEKNQQS